MFLTVVAEAVKTGVGAALVCVGFTAGASEATATATAETQRETVPIRLLNTHRVILAGIAGLAGQELTIGTWIEAKAGCSSSIQQSLEMQWTLL